MPINIIRNDQDAIDEILETAAAIRRNLDSKAENATLPFATRQAASNASARIEEARTVLTLARVEVEKMRIPVPQATNAIHEPERARVL
jgi:hypothetical protein